MRKWLMPVMAAAGLFAGLSSAVADPNGDRILGVWHTTDDKSQVQIFKENNQYFGKILSLKEANWPAGSKLGKPGTPKNDRNNPDPGLRSRSLIGIRIMNDFVYDGKNIWAKGKVYDPENGKTYHGKITMVGTNRLELRGFIGISLLGRTVVWTR